MIYILPTDTCFGIGCAIYDTKSYHKIYDIKKRDLQKPLAIMVESYDWLLNYTSLNQLQIDFLKNYSKPFSVISNCPNIKMLIDLGEGEFIYENKEIYNNFSFRVANNDIELNLIQDVGPIFLTSANLSGEKEIYNLNEAKKQFENHKKDIKFLGESIELNSSIKPSDIFEFISESIDIKYLRN